MVAVSITPKFKGGGLDKLNELIQKRMNELNETYRDAVVATAITALQSIRKNTKRFKGKEVKVNG